MADAKIDLVPADKSEAEDPQRRNLAMAVFGALGGAAFLEACASADGGAIAPEQRGAIAQGLTGTSTWFDTIIGTSPALASSGSAGTNPGQIALVAGRAAIGDGGGGLFYWDPNSSATANNAMVVQSGTSSGRWRRIFSGPVNVKWFGAKGDGTTDDRAAIQACSDFVRGLYDLQPNPFIGGTTPAGSGVVQPVYKVYLPAGSYYVSDQIFLYGSICGEHQTVMRGAAGKPILRVPLFSNTVEDIVFYAGKHAVVFLGLGPNGTFGTSNTVDGLKILRCQFRFQEGPSIKHDVSQEARVTSQYLLVKDCYFEGPCFYWGSCDDCAFEDCYVIPTYQQSGQSVPADDAGVGLGVWNSGDNLNLVGIAGGARTGGTAWIRGTGNINVTRCRIGGEAPLLFMRESHDVVYQGFGLQTEPSFRLILSVQESPIASCVGQNWLEIWSDFPAHVSVRSMSPSNPGTELTYEPFEQSNGIWVKNGVPIPTDFPGQAVQWHLEAFPGMNSSCFRIRQSDDRTSKVGTELWPQARQFVHEPYPLANDLYPAHEGPLNNLYYPDCYDLGQHVTGTALNMASTSGGDTSVGYALTLFMAIADGGLVQFFLRNTSDANWSATAGQYVFSGWVKTSYAAEISIGRSRAGNSQQVLHVLRTTPGVWTRFWCPYYHNGIPQAFLFNAGNIPNGGTLVAGLFAVHRGSKPRPYTYPMGSSTTLAAPVPPADPGTANGMVENWVRSHYRLAAPPTNGVFLPGDII